VMEAFVSFCGILFSFQKKICYGTGYYERRRAC
jgi:hypothetical protein